MKFCFARNFVIFRRKVAKSSEKREIRLHSFCTVLYLKNDENCEELKVQREKTVLESPILPFFEDRK